MNTCKFNLSDFTGDITNLMLDDTLTDTQLLQKIVELSRQHSVEQENIESAAQAILELSEGFGKNITENEIEGALQSSLISPSTDQIEDQTTDSLDKDSMYIENKEIYSKSIKIEAFDNNAAAYNYYNKVVTDMIVRSMIWTSDNKIVATDKDVNLEINKYQEKLYQQVLNYLKQSGEDISKVPSTLYTNNFTEYTEALEKVGQLFNFDQFNNKTLQSKFLAVATANPSTKKKLQTEIDGYNAWVILNNFDSTIKGSLGKSVAVDNTLSPLTPANSTETPKYSFQKAKSSNMNQTWRTSEDIDITKEINNVVQLIIESVPLKGSGRNLKFNEFGYAIVLLKKQLNDINFDNLSISQKASLSKDTREALPKTYKELIANIRVNAQKYIPVLFEIAANEDIRNTIGLKLEKQDIAIIDSIYDGLFAQGNSLLSAQRIQGYTSNNYLGDVTQAADSISSASYLQYFRNSDGNIYVRNMYDQTIDNIIRNLRNTLTISNSRLLHSFDKYSGDVTAKIDENILKSITYKISNSVNLVVSPTNIMLLKNDAETGYANLTEDEQTDIKNFIDDILHQNFKNHPEYWSNLIVVLGNPSGSTQVDKEAPVINNLLQLSGHILFNEYISNNIITDSTSPDTILEQIYGDSINKPTYNTQLQEINLVGDGDFNIIQGIAQAQAISTGRLTSAILKDGNNKSIPASSLSRLLGNIWTQVIKQVKQPNSVAKDFKLFDALSGIYQAREFKDFSSAQATDHREFNAGEMTTSELLYDFIEGLKTVNNTRSPLGNGNVAFYPAVYSDKSYIGRITVNLNKLQLADGRSARDLFKEVNGQVSVTSDASNLLNQLLQQEFGEYYTNVDRAVRDTWKNIVDIRQQYNNPNSIYANVPLNFDALNEAYDNSNKSQTPLQYINDIVREYNKEHPNDLIQLVDHTCYEQVNGFLKPNIEIQTLKARYTDSNSIDRFFKNQEQSIIAKLLKNGFSGIPIAYTSNGEAINCIEDLFKLPGANITMNPEEILKSLNKRGSGLTLNPIIAAYNKLNYFVTQEWLCGLVGGQFNHPSKANKYLGLTYMPKDAPPEIQEIVTASQTFKDSDYNTSIFGKSALSTDTKLKFLDQLILDEATRFVAQVKRNVSYTATQHAYQLNSLTGVPIKANVTVIPDNLATIRTINGTETSVPTSDGATYVSPFMGEWENGSLGGAKVGINKKQFIHAYDEKFGVGAIIKTAGFTFTNETMRASIFDRVAMKYMTDRAWYDQNGNPITEVNVLQDYNGNLINWSNPGDIAGRVFIKQGDKYYRIVGILYVGNNTYQRTLQEVTNTEGVVNVGEPITEDSFFTVNSNYDLWNLFGGFNCYEQRPGELELTPSEGSIKIVASIANQVGIELNNNIRTQEDLYQFMKHSDIHYLPTEGAIKQYQTNMEDINGDLNNGNMNTGFLNYFQINMYQSGIQLDKEHNADEEDLSIFTQVISACSAMGYNIETTQELYNILASLARESTSELTESFQNYVEYNDKEGFQDAISKIIARAFINSSSSSEAISYTTSELLKLVRDGKQAYLKDAIPYSDNGLYSKVISTIGSTLTKTAIKIKMSGVLAVLCPSYNRYKIYNGELLNGRSQQDLDTLQTEYETIDNDLLQNGEHIQYDRSYKLYGDNIEELFNYLQSKGIKNARINGNYIDWDIFTINDYNLLRQLQEGNTPEAIQAQARFTEINSVKEAPIEQRIDFLKEHPEIEPVETLDSFIGDRLASKRINTEDLLQLFKDNNIDKTVQNFATMFSKNGTKIDKFISNVVKEWNQIYPEDQTDEQEIKELLIDIFRNYSGKVQISNIGRLQALQLIQPPSLPLPTAIFENVGKGRNLTGYNVYFIGTDENGETQKYSLYDCDVIQRNIQTKSNNKSETQKVLNALSKNRTENTVMINGKIITVDKSSIQINPAEIILPKAFKTRFGLKTNDQLSDILKDPNFFTKRLLKQIKSVIPETNFSVCLSTIGQNNIYILDRNQAVESDNFKRVIMTTKTNSDGTIDRLDSECKVLYTLSKTTDQVNTGEKQDELWQYTDANGMVHEVLVTTTPSHYLQNLRYNYARVSSEISEDVFNTIDIQIDREKKSLKQAIKEYNKDLTKDAKNTLSKEGARIFTSFKKSLEIVAARIPAQSLQSVMTMKVVGFVDSDINTAYVSTIQTFLQGSDYDIDSVSLAMFDFDNGGKFIGWSPYFKLESDNLFSASLTLPFPTSQSIPVANGEPLNIEQYIQPFSNDFTVENNESCIVETDKGYKISLNTPEKIRNFATILKYVNSHGLNFTERYPKLNEVLSKAINKHNFYIQNIKNSRIRESIIKNKLQQCIFDVVNNPSSQQEAQEGVDQVTKPFKKLAATSVKANEESHNVPESFITYVEALRNNQVGKKAVGISAVALKSYFALTQAINTTLEQVNEKTAQHIVGEVTVGENTYRTLSNITCDNPSDLAQTIINYAKQDQDYALALSAFVSLSTDNAKDLALAKLNCTDNTMGMWLYGISLGIPATELMSIMTSPEALALTDELNGNIFIDKSSKSLSQVFSYLMQGPRIQDKYNEIAKLLQLIGNKDPYVANNDVKLIAFMQNSPIEAYNAIINSNIEESFKNDLLHYIKLYTTCNINSSTSKVRDFMKLSAGSEEFRTIGQLLHINQGLETTQQDILNRISILEDIISTRESSKISQNYNEKYLAYYNKIYNQEFKGQFYTEINSPFRSKPIYEGIDLHQFLTDPEYQLQCIYDYDKVKEIYNPLYVIAHVSHYNQYFKLLDMQDQSLQVSSVKYRTIKTLGVNQIEELRAKSQKDKQKIIKRVSNYADYKLITSWFLNNDINVKVHCPIFVNGKVQPNTEEAIANLGTADGRATFKLWMETEVIPNLQRGFNGIKEYPELQNNIFLSGLTPIVYDNTPTGIPLIAHSLTISMSPRNDTDQAIFDQYKNAFNKLADLGLTYFEGDNNYKIVDLLFWYNLCIFQNKQNDISLSKIFEDQKGFGSIKNFSDYIIWMDNNSNILFPTSDEQAMILPFDNPWASTLKRFLYRNRRTNQIEIWTNVQPQYSEEDYELMEQSEEASIPEINGYHPEATPFRDLQNFYYIIPQGDTSNTTETFTKFSEENSSYTNEEGKQIEVDSIQIDHIEDKILDIRVNGVSIKDNPDFKYLSRIPIVYRSNGTSLIPMLDINSIIDGAITLLDKAC